MPYDKSIMYFFYRWIFVKNNDKKEVYSKGGVILPECTSCANQGYCPQENKDVSEECAYYVSTDVDNVSILEYLEDLQMRQREYMSVVQEQGNYLE